MEDIFTTIIQTLNATLRLSVPLILAAIAGLFSEKSGIVDIGLEGKMLAGCFVSASVAYISGNVYLGMISAVGITFMISMLHGFACITNRGDHIISGFAINLIASGLTVLMSMALFNQGSLTPLLKDDSRFGVIIFPLTDQIGSLPFIGTLYKDFLSGHTLLVYVAMIVPFLAYYIMYKTTFGLRIRAVGENPLAVDTAGISVSFLRYRALMVTGVLTGLAGSYIATAQNAGFIRDMTAGQGYIALAALIFGKWRPFSVLFACLLFGFLDAISIRLQGVNIFGSVEIPVQLIQALPYVLTVVLLAGFIGKAVPPKAIGTPFFKERV